jgi:hypothetical protein
VSARATADVPRKNVAIASFVVALLGWLALPVWGLGTLLGPPALILAWFAPRRGPYGVLTWTAIAISVTLIVFLVVTLIGFH